MAAKKPVFAGFPSETLVFLSDLKKNNNRDWFLAHKSVYEESVKAPMVKFVQALGTELRRFAPELETDPARSIFRIYRDVRFSRDKSPYKTHIAASFDPKNLPGVIPAGLYFHLQLDQMFIGGGLYKPGTAELLAVRRQIASQYKKFKKIINDATFRKNFGTMKGEQLLRVPRGFQPDHPAADLLRYKQYLAAVSLPPELAMSPELVPRLASYFKSMMPFVRFFNAALKATPRKYRSTN
jgi:uncharacterized protein (TIGR02453 family)